MANFMNGKIFAGLFILLITGPAAVYGAEDPSELAQRSGCLACHASDTTKIGPAFQEIAKKYSQQKDGVETMVDHIIKGTEPNGVGWMKAGKAHLGAMPANGYVTPDNGKILAQWILESGGAILSKGKFVSHHLEITGLVKHPLNLEVKDLKKLQQQAVENTPLTCQSGADMGKMEKINGVLLRDVLERADIISKAHNDVKKIIVVATATDGYKVVFSWSELFNSPVGQGVIIFFERDGKPLDEEEGQIALISTQDIRTGPRHVKWLSKIQVIKVVD